MPLSEPFTILKEIYNVSNEDYKKRMKFLNEVLELDEFFDRPVRNLSLGQRMRADLGASLLHNPKVLYLDEPTIGLDLVVKDSIRSAIKEINDKYNTTVILTTHDIEDIEELCNRIIIIDNGKKIYDGTLKNLKSLYGNTKKIIFEVKEIGKINNLDLHKRFNLSEDECLCEVNEDEKLISVTFNRHKLQISEIIAEVMKITDVNDIDIRETELADIVKQIYKNGVKG